MEERNYYQPVPYNLITKYEGHNRVNIMNSIYEDYKNKELIYVHLHLCDIINKENTVQMSIDFFMDKIKFKKTENNYKKVKEALNVLKDIGLINKDINFYKLDIYDVISFNYENEFCCGVIYLNIDVVFKLSYFNKSFHFEYLNILAYIKSNLEIIKDLSLYVENRKDYFETNLESLSNIFEISKKEIKHTLITLKNYGLIKYDIGLDRIKFIDLKNNQNNNEKVDTIKQKRESAKKQWSYLYIIECKNSLEHFYKIGKTNTSIRTRFASEKEMPYNYTVLANIKCDIESVFEFESLLHESQEQYSYKPNIEFAGWTECFSKLDWESLQPIIDEYRR